jgi:cation:H+ antiporter
MICASFCLWGVAADGQLDRWEGAMMFGLLCVYIFFCIRKSRSEHAEVVSEFDLEYTREFSGVRDIMKQFGFVLAGLVLLGLGSNMLVDGAVKIATWLGVSQLVIGLTVIAIGTSLPEGVTSIVASIRGQRDIAVGNVVGSNLFNILCVLGLTALVSPKPVSVSSDALSFDIPVMVAVTVICLPIFLSGSVIRRWEGAVFLLYYIAYTTFICLAATGAVDRDLGHPIMYGVVPLTLLTLVLSFYQGVRPANSP